MADEKVPTPTPGAIATPTAAPISMPTPASAPNPSSTPAGASVSDDADRQRHANFLTSLFGVLTGAILFIPSILGIIQPPFVLDGLLYIFWLAGVLSLVLLGFAIYLLRFARTKAFPHRLSGGGFWLALLALASLVVYVAVNGVEDRTSPPYIQSVRISPPNPKPGEIVEISAEAGAEAHDRLNYVWSVDGKEVARGKVAYWAVPRIPGKHTLRLFVGAASRARAQSTDLTVIVSEKEIPMSKTIYLINASIMQGLERVRERDHFKFDRVYSAYDEHRLPALVATHFFPEDTEVYHQVIPRAFESAVFVLPDAELQNLLLGLTLPSCKDYPGLWPFCKND